MIPIEENENEQLYKNLVKRKDGTRSEKQEQNKENIQDDMRVS